ncbi:MAG: hypothetical protein FK733_07140 [Asgard group archaeon]|nr:hypothetical protein [Asgard group archaeon]
MVKEKGKIPTVFCIIFIICLLCNVSFVNGSELQWKKRDKFKWSYYEKTHSFSNRYGFQSSTRRIEGSRKLKVASINTENLTYLSKYSSSNKIYLTSSNSGQSEDREEFSNEYTKSYNASTLFDYYNSLVSFIEVTYEWNEYTQSNVIEDFVIKSDYLIEHFSYILDVDWEEFNIAMKTLIDPEQKMGTYGYVTFNDFLNDITSYTIMGESDITSAIENINNSTRFWSFYFDLSNVLLLHLSFNSFYDEARFRLNFGYSSSGVLENIYFEKYLDYYGGGLWESYSEIIEINRLPVIGPFGIAASIIIPLLIITNIVLIGKSKFKKQNMSTNETRVNKNKSYLLEDSKDITQKYCSICKLELRDEQKFKQCPFCMSIFHEKHINEWLQKNKDCPVCDQMIKF